MKLSIQSDERYPLFFIVDGGGVVVDVSEETAARWAEVEASYEVCQKEMHTAVEVAVNLLRAARQ